MSYQAYRTASLAFLVLLAGSVYWLTGSRSANHYGTSVLPASAVRTTAGDESVSALHTSSNSPGISRPASGQSAARAQLDLGLAARRADPTPLLQLAGEITTQDATAGVKAYRDLTESYPESVAAWVGLATAYREAGEVSKSRAALNRVFKLDPENASARLLSGRLYAQADPSQVRRALQEWRRILESAAGTPEAEEALRLLQLYEGR